MYGSQGHHLAHKWVSEGVSSEWRGRKLALPLYFKGRASLTYPYATRWLSVLYISIHQSCDFRVLWGIWFIVTSTHIWRNLFSESWKNNLCSVSETAEFQLFKLANCSTPRYDVEFPWSDFHSFIINHICLVAFVCLCVHCCLGLWNLLCAPLQRYRATMCAIDLCCIAPTWIVQHQSWQCSSVPTYTLAVDNVMLSVVTQILAETEHFALTEKPSA